MGGFGVQEGSVWVVLVRGFGIGCFGIGGFCVGGFGRVG